ncbi:MAG: MBL fold metallo-hydrolase [Gammaproteobacteria bacterium]
MARNPSPFTFHGTGTYIVGRGKVAVLDPGPDLAEHIDAIVSGLRGERITHLVVTHTHRDHSPAARALVAASGAKTYGYGPHGAGRIEIGGEVEEGGDMDFVPDVEVRHGDIIEGAGWSLECVYTPGHTSNHMCYQLREEQALFTGDHVMGWSTSVIAPPDGDMGAYLHSLELLLGRADHIYWPTHGPCIDDPKPFVRAFIAHRQERAAQILACLAQGMETIPAMVAEIYRDVPAQLHPAAALSTLAALVYLVERGEVDCEGTPPLDACYRLSGRRPARGP